MDTLPRLKNRKRHSHKGTYGKILIIGGSLGMAGAPALAARAALRSGAGLVRMAVPEPIWQTCCLMEPCATCLPLPIDADGQIDTEAGAVLLTAASDCDAVAIGPGMGIGHGPRQVLQTLLRSVTTALIIDADGLNNLARLPGTALTPTTILTPHPGEMARLWTWQFRGTLPQDRCQQACQLASRTGAVVVLKGADTVITDGHVTHINPTGNPGMATGGTGDALTGITAALAADRENNLTPLQAAQLAAYIHGLAGDIAARQASPIAMTAQTLIDCLPQAWQTYLQNHP